MKIIKKWFSKNKKQLWHIVWLSILGGSYILGGEKDVLYTGFAAVLCYLHEWS